MYHKYGNLKVHFDKLITEPPAPGHVVDPIRGLYHEAFNRKIALFDVYRTHLNTNFNPVNNIITLIGDDGHKPLKTGVMADYKGLVYIDTFTEDIFKISDIESATKYIRQIYKDMDVIVSQDPLYNDLSFARNNPYSMYLRVIPLYVAFHHIGSTIPNALDWGIFEQIIKDKLIATEDTDVNTILESMSAGRYSDEPWKVFSAVSCSSSIELFKTAKKDRALS